MPVWVSTPPPGGARCEWRGRNSRDVGGGLCALRAKTNDPGLARHALVIDVDVITAAGKIATGAISDGNIIATGCIVEHCLHADRDVFISDRVKEHRLKARDCIAESG